MLTTGNSNGNAFGGAQLKLPENSARPSDCLLRFGGQEMSINQQTKESLFKSN
jgi:hypothetical protein